MKADIFVQGIYFATIDIPGDTLLALLAKGMLAEAQTRLDQLNDALTHIDGISCKISLTFNQPATYPPGTHHQPHQEQLTWPDKKRPNGSLTRPTKP